MKLTKRILKIKTALAGRMSPKNRRWLVKCLARLEEMKRARSGK